MGGLPDELTERETKRCGRGLLEAPLVIADTDLDAAGSWGDGHVRTQYGQSPDAQGRRCPGRMVRHTVPGVMALTDARLE